MSGSSRNGSSLLAGVRACSRGYPWTATAHSWAGEGLDRFYRTLQLLQRSFYTEVVFWEVRVTLSGNMGLGQAGAASWEQPNQEFIPQLYSLCSPGFRLWRNCSSSLGLRAGSFSGNFPEDFPAPEIPGRKSLGCRAETSKNALEWAGHGRDEPRIILG